MLPGAIIAVMGCAHVSPPALPDQPPVGEPLARSTVAGLGRVRVDVVGKPARVELVEGRDYAEGTQPAVAANFNGGVETTWGERVRPACDKTPCDLELPYGTYELRYTQGNRTDTGFVSVDPAPSVAVHAIGERRRDSTVLNLCGGFLAATALIAFPIGAGLVVTSPEPGSGQTSDDRRTIGLTTLLVGGAALVGAAVCLTTGPGFDRSGPTRQWPVAERP
jgi:hypothetical protein